MDETIKNIDIEKISHELTYHRYLMNKGQVQEFFRNLSVPDYIALHNIDRNKEMSEIYQGRTYLKELSEKMQISMRQTSNMIGKLRDRGLVIWSHDGNGSTGRSFKKLLWKGSSSLWKRKYDSVVTAGKADGDGDEQYSGRNGG